LATVTVESIPDRAGQVLRAYLQDQLNPTGAEHANRHRLAVSIQEPRRDLGLSRSDVTQRVGYAVVANFRLLDPRGEVVFSGNAISSTNFEVTSSQYATLAARDDARDRLLRLIAQDIRNQLAGYFVGQRQAARQ